MKDLKQVANAVSVVNCIASALGVSLKGSKSETWHDLNVWCVQYPADMDISAHLPLIHKEVDERGWQLITIEDTPKENDGQLKRLCATERIPERADRAYHVAPEKALDSISRDGILPSNHDRKLTSFPDTEGKIHVCLKLIPDEGKHNGAKYWHDLFSTDYNQSFVILEIDTTAISPQARMYRDPHSCHGVIIDQIEAINPSHIKIVDRTEYNH